LLGWSPVDNQEIFTLQELIEAFDYRNMSKSPAVFDTVKLKWMNGEYIKAMEDDKFFELAKPYIEQIITKNYDLEKLAIMVKSRIEVWSDIAKQIDFFEKMPEYDTEIYTHKKMKTNEDTSLEVLKEMLPLFEAHEEYNNDALYEVLKKYIEEKECKNGYAMWPVRIAVSGKQNTPGGATEIMEILGKEETITRLKQAIQLLEQ